MDVVAGEEVSRSGAMVGDFPIGRRQANRPIVEAYNSFATILVIFASVLTFFLILTQSPPVADLFPILGVAAFLTFIYLKDVRPKLKKSTHSEVGRGSGTADEVMVRQKKDDQGLSLSRAQGRRVSTGSRVVGYLFLITWLAWFFSFIEFLEANTAMWGVGASTTTVRSAIASSEPMLRLSLLFLASAIIVTAYAERRKLDFPIYPIYGLWQSSFNASWFERFWWYSFTAESVLFVAGLGGVARGCLAPCSAPGWGDVALLSALMLPVEFAAVDVVACVILLRRARGTKEGRVPLSFVAATLVWVFVGFLALLLFQAVISNPLP